MRASTRAAAFPSARRMLLECESDGEVDTHFEGQGDRVTRVSGLPLFK